jgi:hypothetical protein
MRSPIEGMKMEEWEECGEGREEWEGEMLEDEDLFGEWEEEEE